LRELCRAVSADEEKALAEAEFRAVRKSCRTILAQGARELPEIPSHEGPARTGREIGRAQPARAPCRAGGRLVRVSRTTRTPAREQHRRTGAPDGEGEVKASGRFRTPAPGRCAASPGCFDSTTALGYAPFAAIRIALAGEAVGMVGPRGGQSAPDGGERLPCTMSFSVTGASAAMRADAARALSQPLRLPPEFLEGRGLGEKLGDTGELGGSGISPDEPGQASAGGGTESAFQPHGKRLLQCPPFLFLALPPAFLQMHHPPLLEDACD